MKAAELLERYQTGQRDFSGNNLRGQDFQGQNLSGAIFANTDIRGTNFAYANLTATTFTQAQAGLQKRWVVILGITLLLVSAISGVISACLGFFSTSVLDTHVPDIQPIGVFVLVSIAVFVFALIRQGTRKSLISVSTSTLILVLIYAGASILTLTLAKTTAAETAGRFFLVLLGLVLLVGTLVLTLVGPISIVSAIAIAGPIAIIPMAIIALMAAITTSIFILSPQVWTPFFITRISFSIAIAILLISVNIHIGWRASQGDQRDIWIRSTACALATIGGTSFRRAKLTEANFSEASLQSTDLRQAFLLRTCWRHAENLEQVRSGGTYLHNPKIRQLVVNGNGQEQAYRGLHLTGLNLDQANFFRADLSGTNLQQSTLQATNLASANLIGANLNQANLKGANLANTKLMRAQLEQTDLTGVTLTGAYLENWRIDGNTKLDNIRCDYVFMHLPDYNSSSENRYRKPDNWNQVFAEGEFADLIAPLPRTLDLYHTEAVDACAVAIAFHALQTQNPQAKLTVVAIEKRGQNRRQLLVRVAISQPSDLSKLHSDYFKQYEHLLTLPTSVIHSLLMEKGKDTQLLTNLINLSLE